MHHLSSCAGRSGWAGTSYLSAALWSGDIETTFAELALQIKVAQGVAMSGIPLWTTDIGTWRAAHNLLVAANFAWLQEAIETVTLQTLPGEN